MLAMAGVAIALVPGSPSIGLDPHTALALFIAPVLLDAAYDFPVHAAWRHWRTLVALSIGAVLLTAAVTCGDRHRLRWATGRRHPGARRDRRTA